MIIKQQQLHVPTTSELRKAMSHAEHELDMPTSSISYNIPPRDRIQAA